MLSNGIFVTIDGGSATKKSPVSQAIATKFNLVYIEIGTLFRTVVHALMRAGITPELKNADETGEFLKDAKCAYFLEGRQVKFVINKVYLTAKDLRAEDINANVAKYTALFKSMSDFCMKHARKATKLKDVCKFNGIIAEGRTCGTYIFPKADVKFWFIATDTAKIDFRLGVEKENDDPIERDKIDFSITFYPVVKPKNAIEIWTSSRTTEENIALVSAFVEQKLDVKKHSK
ncbi:MAG: (d)CMP kinase [Puniceicoccales bacterium]|jgi:cytidylate kinase|nr:(d)CMP kinase [Puniceicoccales bacterium]